jgi:uncharacterized protein YjbJ (UPF0337 family)
MNDTGGIERKLLAAVEQTKGKLKAAAGAINGNEVLQRQGEAQRDRASADIETYRRQDEAAEGAGVADDQQATG